MGGASNSMFGSGVNPDASAEALLDAILADPADDAPRLVYADHLLSRGDPASARRGELIVVQCARERLEREKRRASPAYRRAREREAELAEKRIGFRDFVERMTRGFISQVWIDPGALRRRWPQLRREPLEWITFQRDYGPVPDLADLAWLMAQPEAARLRTIGLQTSTGSVSLDVGTLAAQRIPEEAVSAWPDDAPPDAALAPAVRRLHFHDWKPAFGPFIQRVAPALVELSVSGMPDPALIARIATLQKLSAWLDPDVAFTLLDAMALPVLRDLALQGRNKKPLGKEGAARLARSPALATLTSLVADVPLDDVLAPALADRAPKLEVLSPGLGVTEAGLRAFVASTLPARLRWLSLTNRGEVTYARLFAEAPFAKLESLKLEGFTFDEASAELLANHAGLGGLVDFKLTLCAMKPAAARALVRSRHLENVIAPKFTQCRFFRETEDILRERWPDAIFLGA